MDKVILLFRVIAKIAMVEGAACRGHPHFNPVRGGSIRGHVGLHPSSFDGLQYPIFVLEVLLGAILAAYVSIALAYALQYYKSLRSMNYFISKVNPPKTAATPHEA